MSNEVTTVPNITPDERTVLEIAARGESMMPIGRWEKPVESLVAKGLLRRVDKFNNYITPEGYKALGEEREEADDKLFRALTRVHKGRVTYERTGEEVAKGLAAMAKEAVKATGDDLQVALKQCAKAVEDRASEILREQS